MTPPTAGPPQQAGYVTHFGCPCCAAPLRSAPTKWLLLVCDRCGGAWADDTTATRIATTVDAQLARIALPIARAAVLSPAFAQQRPRRCPECSRPLVTTSVRGVPARCLRRARNVVRPRRDPAAGRSRREDRRPALVAAALLVELLVRRRRRRRRCCRDRRRRARLPVRPRRLGLMHCRPSMAVDTD